MNYKNRYNLRFQPQVCEHPRKLFPDCRVFDGLICLSSCPVCKTKLITKLTKMWINKF